MNVTEIFTTAKPNFNKKKISMNMESAGAKPLTPLSKVWTLPRFSQQPSLVDKFFFLKKSQNKFSRNSDILLSRWRYTIQGRARRSVPHTRRSFSLRKERLIIFSTRPIYILSRQYRVSMFTVGVYRHCVLCEVYTRADGPVKHR